MSWLEDAGVKVGSLVLGKDKINEILINKLVSRGRNRPHPWSTRCDHICWSGMTDRTYNGRLLPPFHCAGPEGQGTARPPLAAVTALFAADPAGQRVCPKSTCLFPAFAQYLTDGFIRTLIHNNPPFGDGVEDRRKTTSNHDIDLSPLYGRTWRQTEVLRDSAAAPGRKGRLKSQIVNGEEYPPYLYDPADDTKMAAEFCEADGTPILDHPLGAKNSRNHKSLFAAGGDRVNAAPQIAMINTLLLREHNRLAAMLDGQNPDWDDDAVFQTSRNILIPMFLKIVVEEYINHINSSNFSVMAKPDVARQANWYRTNWITVEFSLLYRWLLLVPSKISLGGKQLPIAALLLDNKPLTDGGLAAAFADFSANNATELGLGNSDAIFVTPITDAEPRAVMQGRTNNLAGYTKYRAAMKLDPVGSFADIVGKSKDPVEQTRRNRLAANLQILYGNVDNLEFYVGLFAEPREKNRPLPRLITAMVAMHAFSQVVTNP